jgi:hypothetical protein
MVLESLEDRRLLDGTSCSYDSGANAVSCTGSGDLYLYVDGGSGTFQYGDDANVQTSGTPISIPAGGNATVSFGASDTVFLTGMTGGGVAKFDMTGPVQITGNVSTLGGSLEIDAVSVIVGAAAISDSGTLTNGNQSFEIKSSDSNSRAMVVAASNGVSAAAETPSPCEQSDAMLADGQTLTFSGTSGSSPYSLQDGAEYRVQVIHEDKDSGEFQIQLFALSAPPAVISTSPAAGASAAAGAITLNASRGDIAGGKGTYLATPTVTLGPGSELQATGNGGDGAITLKADDTFEFVFNFTLANQIDDLFNHKFQATIEVGRGVAIAGGDVALTASAGISSALTSTPNIGQAIGIGVLGFLSTIIDSFAALPVSVLITRAAASTELDQDATILSSGTVSMSSSATANSTGEATNFLTTIIGKKGGSGPVLNALQALSFAFSQAESNARTLVDEHATITAAGDVSIGATTKTTVSATSLESRNQPFASQDGSANPNAFGLSAAVNELNTTSYAIVATGATIQSTQGNISIAAAATDKNTVKVQSNIYRNGIAGLSGAGASIHADVQACVDGTIIAGGRDTGSAVTFNPLATIDSAGASGGTSPVINFADSRLEFLTDPGYATGEPLMYSSGVGGPIPGLANNTTYYAVASQSGDQHFLQLAATSADALAAPPKFIAFGQYPTINGIPITNVDTGANNSLLFDFDPGFSEGQPVTVVPAAGQFLGYDHSDGSLAGLLAGTYRIHLANDGQDDTGLFAIQLRNADGSTLQLDARPFLTTASGQTLRIQSVNVDGDLLVLDPADVPSGFALQNGATLTYHAALATNISGLNDGATYYAIVDPRQFADVTADSLLTLQLAATAESAASANPVTALPTFTWIDSQGLMQSSSIEAAVPSMGEALIGEGFSLSIVGSDPDTDVLTVAWEDAVPAGQPILHVGDLFVYVGAVDDSSTLQSGRAYQVADVVDQTNPAAMQLKLRDAVRLPTLGVLTQTSGAGQSFTIQTVDAASDNLLTITRNGSGSLTPLTEGETVTYTGASIAGFLISGQSYRVHVVQQESPSLIQVQLTPNYFITPSGTLLDQAGQTFSITSSDPGTAMLTVTGPMAASLSNGQTLTYQGPAIASSGYLQTGQSYAVTNPTSTAPGQFTLQLIAAAYQLAESGVLQGSGQAPTGTSDNFNPLGHSFQIVGSDGDTGILTISLLPQSEFATIAEGEILRYQGPSGTAPNRLQDGQLYAAHVVDQSDSTAIRIQLQTLGQLAGYGTLIGPGGQYVIHQSDTDGAVWLSQIGSAEALVDGDTVTFQGTSGSGSLNLQDGQAYQVSVLDQSDPSNMQVRLARYLSPTYGTLAGGGSFYSISDFNSGTEVVTIATVAGSNGPPLADGQLLVFTGAAINRTSLLQNGQSYAVRVIDARDPDAIALLLLDPNGPLVSSISTDGSDPAAGAVIIADTAAPIPDGAIVTFHRGGPNTEIGGLHDGVAYRAVVNSASPTTIHLVQTGADDGQPVELSLYETLSGNGQSYFITGSDGMRNTLTISQPGAATGSTFVVEGDALVYTGALGQLTGGLVDGQTYYVHLPNPSDTTTIQLLASPNATSPLTIQTSVRLGQLNQSFLSGTSHSLTPVNKAGISITATLSSTDQVSVTAGIGSEPIGKQVGELGNAAHVGLVNLFVNLFGIGAMRKPLAAAPAADQFSSFLSASGSVLVQQVINSAVAQVGGNAVLKSARDIAVNSAITEKNQTSNSATNWQAKPKDGTGDSPRNYDLAISVTVNQLKNTAQAEIAGNAVIDAAGALAVASDVIYPWAGQIANPEKFNTGLVFKGLFKGGLLQSELVNNWSMAASTAQNEAKLALAGSVSYIGYDNTSTATIGAGAVINQDPLYRNAAQSVTVDAQTNLSTVNYTGNTWFNFGLINAAANRVNNSGWTGVGNTIFGGRNNAAAVGIGASLTYIHLVNTTKAIVGGPGTKLNFGQADASLNQSFDGDSDVDVSTYSIKLNSNPGFTTGMPVVYDNGGGDSIGGLTSGDTYYAIVSPSNPRTIQLAKTAADAIANQPTKFKSAGSGTQSLTSTATGGFHVTAAQNVVNVNLGTSGGVNGSGLGSGGKYGGNGTFAAFTANTTTVAQVASGSEVHGNPGTSGAVNIAANDSLTQVSVVGGAFKGQNIGVGLSGIWNDVSRITKAIVGDEDDPTNPANGNPGSSTWNVPGAIAVSAATTGDVISFALAAAVAAAPTAKQQGGGQPAAGAPVQQSSWGLQVSGDASFSKLTDNTYAYVNDSGTLTSGHLSVTAADSTILVGFGGSFAIAYLSPGNDPTSQSNAGVAGSYAEINLGGSTEAFIQHAHLNATGDVSVTAERDNYLGTLTASTAAASATSYKSSWEVAGSVALSFFSGDTKAYLSDVSGSVSGDLTVTATDKTIYVAVGGAIGVASSLGIGVSFGYISIGHDIDAYAEATQIAVGGHVVFDATAQTDVGSLGVALGVAEGASWGAAAGNASVNEIAMTLDAHVSDNSSITSAGAVSIQATDHSYLVSVSGSVAVAQKGAAAVGAAVSYNLIDNSIQAYIADSAVRANGGSLTVSAVSTPTLIAVAVGGSDADNVAIGGSVTINSITNTVEAYLKNATVFARGDLNVTATESALLVAVAGAVALTRSGSGSGDAAIGAAVAYNYIGQSFDTANPAFPNGSPATQSSSQAYIAGSQVTVDGDLLVSAGFQPTPPLPDVTQVTIDGSTGFGFTLDLSDAIEVDTQLVAVAVGGAGAASFTLGGAITMAYVRQTIQAYVADSSSVNVSGNVTVSAIDDSSIGTGSGGGAIAGSNTAAVGAGVAYNDLQNNLLASIDNSSVTSSGSLSVVSQETSDVTAVAVGGSEADRFALGGALVISVIDNDAEAHIRNSSTVQATSVLVSSTDHSTIKAGAGQVSIATNGVSVGAAVTVSNLTNTTLATIENSSATATGTRIQILADSDLDITAAAAGLDVANDFTLGGSVVYNSITSTTKALIDGSTTNSAGLAVSATDNSNINTGAGNASIGIDGYGAMGAGIAINRIDNTVEAHIDASTVTSSGRIDVTAETDETILAVALGISGSVTNTVFSLSLVGSGAGNRVTSSTQALIAGGSTVTTTAAASSSSPLNVIANDSSSITAGAGALAFDVSLFNGSASAAVGVSAAVNEIGTTDKPAIVSATISGSTVTAAGDVVLTAIGNPTITSYTVAGAGDFSGGASGASIGIAGAGAGSSNTITATVQALVEDSAAVTTTHGGDVNLSATNGANIVAGAGGIALAGAVGGSTGVAVSVGAALALNDLAITTAANIQGATVHSAGDVGLLATDNSKITAVAVGVAGSLASGSEVGVAIGGAGSGVGNAITNTTQAQIADSNQDGSGTRSSVTSGGDVGLKATDNATIIAAAGTLAFSIGLSFGAGVAVAPAIGVSVAINTITNTVTANIMASMVDSAGDVTLTAQSLPPTGDRSIQAVTIAGGAAVGVSTAVSVAFAGAGAGSGNTINNTVTASITTDSAVTAAGDIRLSAHDGSSILADGGGATVSVGVGEVAVAPGIGAGEAKNTVSNTTQAWIDASQATATGHVAVDASSSPDIRATAFGVGVSVAVSASAGIAGAGSGAAAYNEITNATSAAIQNGSTVTSDSTDANAVSVSATEQPTYTATSGSGSLGFSLGEAAVALAIGVSLARNTVSNSTVEARIGRRNETDDETEVTATSGGVQVSADSHQTATATSIAVTASIAIPTNPDVPISVALSGSGASSKNELTNTITAAIDGGADVQASGAVRVAATETPHVDAKATGAAASLGVFDVAVAGTVAHSTVNATIISYLGDATGITAGSLTVAASQSQNVDGDPTVSASATAGSGAILAGVDGAKSTASTSGSVEAYTGTGVTLPDGDVRISATSSTLQSAQSLGVTVGYLAVGGNDSTATSNVQTSATLGADPAMNAARTGALIVQATGSDRNAAWAIAGSGGIVSGNGASAKTENTSTVAAQLSGGTIYAGNVIVSAANKADYAPGVNSINASVAGASGAEAKNDHTTSATVTIGNNTAITAAGTVSIGAQNNYTQSANENASSINKGASAYAGAGGVITGAAAGNHATLNGTASVSLGDSVAIRSGTNPLTNPGGIGIVATSGIDAQDSVLLSTGGFIEGGGTSSKIDATIANSVMIGASNSLISWGNIAAGTFNTVHAQTTSQANTGGVAGTADAHASTSVASTQAVTVGSGSTIQAFGNVNLIAGDDPTGLHSPLFIGSSDAQAYAYGGITIPHADSTTALSSDSTLTINGGVQIGSGRNVTIAALDGSPTGTQSYAHLWNGAGSPSTDPATINTTTSVTQNGDITAGIFHELTLTIPDDGSAGVYSNTLQIDSSGPADLDFAAIVRQSSSFNNQFKAPDFINQNFSSSEASLLTGSVSSDQTPVGAFTLGPLFAAGGSVTVNGTLQTSSGTITAYGAPGVTVTNHSPDYLVLGPILIPNAVGGQVILNGTASTGDTASGIAIYLIGAGETPAVTIELDHNGPVGDSTTGPALLVTGTISNLGGSVSITNDQGSLGQAATIYGQQVSISAPHGNVAITIPPPGVEYLETNPYSNWQDYMTWPGGNPSSSTSLTRYVMHHITGLTWRSQLCDLTGASRDMSAFF